MPRLYPRSVRIGRAAVVLSLLLGAGQAQAQIANGNLWPKARLTVLMPPGGKVGTTFEVTFTGTDLEEPQGLYFSHPGIKAVPVIPPSPKVDPKAKVDPKTKTDPKAKADAKKKPAPAPPPITKFAVTIGNDVPPGNYDARFIGKHGVSNPRVFIVGTLAEVAEKEPNNDVEQAQKVALGTTISGVISTPTDVDYSSFAGKKGQRVVIACLCASIDSRLHPEMELIGPNGRTLATSRPVPEHDGLLTATLPVDGDYTVRLVHFTYTQGGPEYFYRLNISTEPRIEAIFPPMVEPGKMAQIALYGHNLPGSNLEPNGAGTGRALEKLMVHVTAPADSAATARLAYSGHISPVGIMLDGFEFRLQTPQGASNPVLNTYAKAPVVLDNDKNDTPATAQEIPLPCEVAGRIDRKNDRDWYVMTCQKGQSYNFELLSDRLGAPTMLYLKIRDQAAKPPRDIVSLDDNNETLSNKGLYSVSRDPPMYKFTAPADGKYHVVVGSHLSTLAGPTHVYRLRITAEMPDFRLIVMPSGRLPSGFGLGGTGRRRKLHRVRGEAGRLQGRYRVEHRRPAGRRHLPAANLVVAYEIHAPRRRTAHRQRAPRSRGEIKVIGTAIVGGQKVVREGRPASISWATQAQQNIPTITRLDKSLVLAVRGKAPAKLSVTPDKAVISVGSKLDLALKLTRLAAGFKANFQVTPVQGEFPPGISFGNLTFTPGKDDQKAVLTIASSTPPGTYNLVFPRLRTHRTADAAKNKPVNTILPSMPVQITVLPEAGRQPERGQCQSDAQDGSRWSCPSARGPAVRLRRFLQSARDPSARNDRPQCRRHHDPRRRQRSQADPQGAGQHVAGPAPKYHHPRHRRGRGQRDVDA